MKGLSQSFTLVNGKFSLIEGRQKQRDNLFFLLSFTSIHRIYLSDFSINLIWLVQKPSSAILLFKPLILGTLRKKIVKYVENIDIPSMDFFYRRSTLSYGVALEINYLKNETTVSNEAETIIKFI